MAQIGRAAAEEMGRRGARHRRRSRRHLQRAESLARAIQRGLLKRIRSLLGRRILGAHMSEPAGGAAGGDGAEPLRKTRGPMNWLIDFIELVAAAFIGIVAADIFISVMLRYFFSVQIPDAYDFGRLLLGILIFWGIAAT